MRKATVTYSELAIARESAMVTCILAETQRQWKKEKAPGSSCLEAVSPGKL